MQIIYSKQQSHISFQNNNNNNYNFNFMFNGLCPPPIWTSDQNNLINNNDKKKQSSGFSIKSGNKYFFNMNNIILNEEDSQIKNEENKNDDNKNKENKNNEEKEEKNLKIKLKPNFYLDYDNKLK